MSQSKPHPTDDPRIRHSKNESSSAKGEEEEEEDIEEIGNRFLFFNVMPSWMVSFLTHIAVIVILAVIIMPERTEKKVALEAGERSAEPLDAIDLNLDAMEFSSEDPFESEISEETASELTEELEVSLPEAQVEMGDILGGEETSFELDSIGELSAADTSNETSSRTGDSKKQMLRQFGGNAASEEAVALALKWIVDHQLPDGGWNLDHQRGPGNHRTSSHPGEASEARAGATALALLPLLGNGQTHKTGTYRENVQMGLDFLMKRARRSGSRGSISYLEPGGSMYSHGLVSIVFCEAYAMTKDPILAPFAQGTVWFIEDAQDPIGGGWRYRPREPGDTSAVGWQLMALKSGKISGLDINPRTYKRAEKFLDSVSTSGGAFYGYMSPPAREMADARTAVGLLCRMYMGWKKDTPGIVDGVNAMANRGPDTTTGPNMYYNYYATQVMKHIGGRTWNDWNIKMRDHLIASQEKNGPAAGSWTPGNGHAEDKGGRLYTTSLSCMTLEVYYRYLPLYGEQAANDEFPLD
jgi:hypothetical protein